MIPPISTGLSHLKKTVVLTRCFPKNIDQAVYGIFQRFHLILESLCSISSEVVVVFFVEEEILETVKALNFKQLIFEKWGVKLSPVFIPLEIINKGNSFAEYVLPIISARKQNLFSPCGSKTQSSLLNDIISDDTDLIFVHRLNSFYPILNIRRKLPPIAFDLDDVEHKKFYRDLRLPPYWLGKLAYYLHIPALFFGEIRSIWRSKIIFVCSETDRKYLQLFAPSTLVNILPNSVSFPALPSGRKRKDLILFLGTYTYGPNVDAAETLIQKIFPLIRKECPSAEVWLVGNKIELLSSYGRDIPGVKFVGFVKSLAEIYQEATVVCCPIRSGGGTRIKIIEAAAYGLPVVSTSIGAEGLDFVDSKEIVLADDDQTIATACVNLLQDYSAAGNIGLNARKIAQRYSRESIISQLNRMLLQIN